MHNLGRRQFLQAGAVGLGLGVSGWFRTLADQAKDKKPKKSCILLWMYGGPSTIDLWDLKPGHKNGGPYKTIETKAKGLHISEHLPKLAEWGQQLGIVRGMSTKEGDHQRATYQMRTGNLPLGGIRFPTIGSLVSKELGEPTNELPNSISVAPQRFFFGENSGAGFLGPNYDPLIIGESNFGQPVATTDIDQILKVRNLDRSKEVTKSHSDTRLELLRTMHTEFAQSHPSSSSAGHTSAYDRAIRLMQSESGQVFDLTQEKDKVRDTYGRNLFGQGCLLARRLVEKGVPFVEVSLGNWDTHANNFDAVKTLSTTLDTAWGALMSDLKDRGLLDSTLILCMGEFGRTPSINPSEGRDHYPNAWSAVLAGGGIKGGQAIGKTSADGTTVEERPTTTVDLLATTCHLLGIDHTKQNMSNVGRPIDIVDKSAEVLKELVP